MPHNIKLLENSIFISDAHYNKSRVDLEIFLEDILDNKILCNQLIIGGDICDLLIGSISYTLKYNKKIINLINNISNKIEVIYLEGNHDFDLKDIFPNVLIFSIKNQPIILKYKDKKILFLHGDKFVNDIIYEYIYVPFARNKIILKILNIIDTILFYNISKKVIKNQIKKNKCFKMVNFEDKIKKREKLLARFNIDMVLEGHYHQNTSINTKEFVYINIPAFVCKKKYLKLKDIVCQF